MCLHYSFHSWSNIVYEKFCLSFIFEYIFQLNVGLSQPLFPIIDLWNVLTTQFFTFSAFLLARACLYRWKCWSSLGHSYPRMTSILCKRFHLKFDYFNVSLRCENCWRVNYWQQKKSNMKKVKQWNIFNDIQSMPSCPSLAARIYLKNLKISGLSDVGFLNSFSSLKCRKWIKI